MELSRHRPDLVLLDEVLPGESGLDLLQELSRSAIPVILLSEMQNPEHAVAAEAVERLRKPGWKSLEEDRVRFGAVIRAILPSRD